MPVGSRLRKRRWKRREMSMRMFGMASSSASSHESQATSPELQLARRFAGFGGNPLQPSSVRGNRVLAEVRMARFEDLDVWKRSAQLSAELYNATATLKDFGFRDHITKTGLSIPSNIAEGCERGSKKELAIFLRYAKGSAGELRTQIYIGMDIGYLEDNDALRWLRETIEISRMLHSLIRIVRTESESQVPKPKPQDTRRYKT